MQFSLPVYENILELHELALRIGGGIQGVLHDDRIHASINRPQSYMDYDESCNIHLVGAIILHSLATGHCFTEGNKRTALLATLVVYNANKVLINYNHVMNDEFKSLVLWVVEENPDVKKIEPKLRELIEKYSANPLSALKKLLSGGV